MESCQSNGQTSDCSTNSSMDPDDSLPQWRDNVFQEVISMYDLYAISCHSGVMGGGHYVTYAKNPNDKWYYYNDSSCKEVRSEEIDTESAYILFYKQQGVDYSQFLTNTDGKQMIDISIMDKESEPLRDFVKSYCVLQ